MARHLAVDQEFSAILTELWKLDVNRVKPGTDYTINLQPDVNNHVISLQFSWKSLVKPLGSSSIGVSPEFEVALFTIIFLKSSERVTNTIVKVDKYLLEIVVCRHGGAIGTS
ncbi:hypothetical protein KOW79_016274 [Hemibagrus wyckioides]|uniref:Uridylate-specific endoribonuclease n=1 Tax=Hemibagrus wyckioides TaxID=337641 RepID=A0A9D3SDI6_9TELE|nr:uridylate-specific endoribonuclease C-like [Hemibagrus wyckioides]KAG7320421.1 hypothetical protein KOW79_016274 [Hemibagrus wyckioides]